MWPLAWSSSYFARDPRGISTKTSTESRPAAGIRSPCAAARGRHDDRDLALWAIGSIPSRELGGRAAHERLVDLGQLARHDGPRVRRDRREIGEQITGPVRALVDDDGPLFREERPEDPLALDRLLRQEAEERERSRRQSRRDQRGD